MKGGHGEGTTGKPPGWVIGILPDSIEDTGINEPRATIERFTEILSEQEMNRELRAPQRTQTGEKGGVSTYHLGKGPGRAG